MARPGVSYYDVAQAANAIQAVNEYPSIDRVRQKLGTGSSTTIANHLRQWKVEHMPSVIDAPKTTLPMPLLTQLQSFWGELRQSAQQVFEKKEANYQTEIEQLNETITAQSLQLHDAKILTEKHNKHIHDVEQQVIASQENLKKNAFEISDIKAENVTLNQTLINKNETITSLESQLSNVTNSLEYFHAAAQKQRDEDSLRHASDINQLDQTIQQLNQQKQMDDKRYQQLIIERERAGFKVEQLELDTSHIQTQLVTKIEESATHKARFDESNTLIVSLQASLEEKDQTLLKFQNSQHDIEIKYRELKIKFEQLDNEIVNKNEIIADLMEERDRVALENERLLQNLNAK